MDASRLLEVLEDIASEFEEGYVKHVQALLQHFNTAKTNPNQDNTSNIDTAFKKLDDFLLQSSINDFPPSKKYILQSIGGASLMGAGGLATIKEVIKQGGISTSGIHNALSEFQSKLQSFRDSSSQAKVSLASLGISAHAVEPNKYEVGVIIPSAMVKDELGNLSDQLHTWNTVLRGFQELSGEKEREVCVRDIASGSYEIFLIVGLASATYLSKAIDKVLDWYKKILEIQEHRIRLRELGAPKAETTEIKKHEKDRLDKSIKELVKEIINDAATKSLPEGRKHELEIQVTFGIKHIAKHVDNGGDLEVTAGLPEVPEEPELPEEGEQQPTEEGKKKYLKMKHDYDAVLNALSRAQELSKVGSMLRELPQRNHPILQIEEGEAPHEETPEIGETRKGKRAT